MKRVHVYSDWRHKRSSPKAICARGLQLEICISEWTGKMVKTKNNIENCPGNNRYTKRQIGNVDEVMLTSLHDSPQILKNKLSSPEEMFPLSM